MKTTLTKSGTRKQIENARALGWHEFVCGYVAAVTERAPFASYVVRKTATGWVLSFMGADMFPPMDAKDLYVWLTRGPLESLRRDADELREFACTS